MEDDRGRHDLRAVFNRAAEDYQRSRPVLPPGLFDDLIYLAGLRPGDRVIEIGCGTGQATVPLAERGLAVTAVELGAELAAIARRRVAGLPGRRGGHQLVRGLAAAARCPGRRRGGRQLPALDRPGASLRQAPRPAAPRRRHGRRRMPVGPALRTPGASGPTSRRTSRPQGWRASLRRLPEQIAPSTSPALRSTVFTPVAGLRGHSSYRFSAGDYLADLGAQSRSRPRREPAPPNPNPVRHRLEPLASSTLTATFVSQLTISAAATKKESAAAMPSVRRSTVRRGRTDQLITAVKSSTNVAYRAGRRRRAVARAASDRSTPAAATAVTASRGRGWEEPRLQVGRRSVKRETRRRFRVRGRGPSPLAGRGSGRGSVARGSASTSPSGSRRRCPHRRRRL